jgi:hypothetical protein
MKINTAFTCIGIVLSLQMFAQDIPLGMLPMQHNGGFSGEGEKARFVVGGGIRPSGSGVRRNNYFGSYDQFFPKLRSGIGVTLIGSQWSGSYNLQRLAARSNSLMLSFSPKFSYKGKHTFAPFMDWSVSYLNVTPDDNNTGFLKDVFSGYGRIGVLYNNSKFYAGIAYYLISITSGKDLPLFYLDRNQEARLQAGYTFQKLPESKFSFTPHVVSFITYSDYYITGFRLFISFDFNVMFRYKKFLWSFNSTGFWLLKNTGAGLGYQNKKFRIFFNQGIFYGYRQSTLALRYVLK